MVGQFGSKGKYQEGLGRRPDHQQKRQLSVLVHVPDCGPTYPFVDEKKNQKFQNAICFPKICIVIQWQNLT